MVVFMLSPTGGCGQLRQLHQSQFVVQVLVGKREVPAPGTYASDTTTGGAGS